LINIVALLVVVMLIRIESKWVAKTAWVEIEHPQDDDFWL